MDRLQVKSPKECMGEARAGMERRADATLAPLGLLDVPLRLPQRAVMEAAWALALDIAIGVLCHTRCEHEKDRPMIALPERGLAGCAECLPAMVKAHRPPDDHRCVLCREGVRAGDATVELESDWSIIVAVCAECHSYAPEPLPEAS